VKVQRSWHGWLMGCMVAMLFLSALAPLAAQAQTLLPVVIKLPPTFLRLAPSAKMALPGEAGVIKSLAAVPNGITQIAALRNTEVRAVELRGLLPHQFDHHYFSLEAAKPGGAFALTLMVEPASVLKENVVNFVVLTEDGMKKVAAGIDPLAVKTAMGTPFLFDQVGNRMTALVPGTLDSKYTVVVFNNGKMPTTYTLRVDGGLLVDNAGQTFSAIKVGAPLVEAAATTVGQFEPARQIRPALQEARSAVGQDSVLAKYDGVVKRFGLSRPTETVSIMQRLLPESVRARQVSGSLKSWQDRHYLNLATDMGGGEITLTLRYSTKGGVPLYLNFWVMTQDGVRHLVQGGMAQELNLAVGLPVAGEPGVYRARLRMAQNLLYTVVVFSEGMAPADYTLSVQGGILVDRYGQTREAQAAEQEILALASN